MQFLLKLWKVGFAALFVSRMSWPGILAQKESLLWLKVMQCEMGIGMVLT